MLGRINAERFLNGAMKLDVSGAFHSPLMEEAAQEMARELGTLSIRPASVPILANVSAMPVQHPEDIRAALRAQR